MAIREITLQGNPVLNNPTREVEAMTEDIRTLIADMWDTMYHAHGVGLAANQVGIDLRLCVIDVSPVVGECDKLVLINPKILETRGGHVDEEGCLSVPGLSELVKRPDYVKLEALNEDMEPFTLEAEGFLAKACCHEVDHLDGNLYLTRLSRLKRELMMRKIKRLKKDGYWDDPYPVREDEPESSDEG